MTLAQRAGSRVRNFAVSLVLRRRPPAPFKVSARDLGELKPGLNLNNVAELIEQVEGPLHR